MKTQIKNKQLISFFNWASRFLSAPNGLDNAFKKAVQINMKNAEPLVEKYQQKQEFLQRDYATVEPGEEGALKKVGDKGELHYSKKSHEKLVAALQDLAEETVEVDVAQLSKEASIPKKIKDDYFAMRALNGIVVQKEMAEKILFEFSEEEPADKEEQKIE